MMLDENAYAPEAEDITTNCAHLKNAVKMSLPKELKKALTKGDEDVRICKACRMSNSTERANAGGVTGCTDDLWMCFFCGATGCGRYSLGHAKAHYEQRGQDHCIALHLFRNYIWCYLCDKFVAGDNGKRLDECVKQLHPFVSAVRTYYRQRVGSEKRPSLASLDASMKSEQMATDDKSDADWLSSKAEKKSIEQRNNLAVNGLIRETRQQAARRSEERFSAHYVVKGLRNLGNTCFYNSTMQNIAQSPVIVAAVHQMSNDFDTFVLRPHKYHCVETKELIEPKEMTVKLDAHDNCPLLEALRAFIYSYHGSSSADPGYLLNEIRRYHRQFSGWAQQDAHELLRCMLDSARTEQLKRFQKQITKQLGLPENAKASQVDPKKRQLAKAYSNVADTQIERVFGGLLLQTIVCEECHHVSTRLEPFFDLSLPIATADACKEVARSIKALRVDVRLKAERDEETRRGVAIMSIDDDIPMEHSGRCEHENEELQHRITQQRLQRLLQALSPEAELHEHCSIDTCLRHFTSVERLTGRNQFGCINCLRLEQKAERLSAGGACCSTTPSPIAQDDDDDDDENGNPSAASSSTRSSIITRMKGQTQAKRAKKASESPKYKLVDADKRYMIFRPPPVLTIHLKRFHKVGWSYRKNDAAVSYPLVLDLAPYTCKYADLGRTYNNEALKELPYMLTGVVVHSGGMGGGHYIAYVRARQSHHITPETKTLPKEMEYALRHVSLSNICRGLDDSPEVDDDMLEEILARKHRTPTPEPMHGNQPTKPTMERAYKQARQGDWYYISDSHTAPSDEATALRQQAYLLFYERL